MRVKFIFTVFVVLSLMLSGCATYGAFTSGATAPEKKQAMCSDAKQGLALAQVGLDIAATPAQQAYWAKYLKGVTQAVELYCTAGDASK